MNKPLKLKTTWSILGLILVFQVIYLSLTPRPPQIQSSIFPMDKVGHFLAYALLVFWYIQISHPKRYFFYFIGFSFMGVCLEFVQRSLGFRSFEYLDMLFNTLGAGISFLFFRKWGDQLLVTLEKIFLRDKND